MVPTTQQRADVGDVDVWFASNYIDLTPICCKIGHWDISNRYFCGERGQDSGVWSDAEASSISVHCPLSSAAAPSWPAGDPMAHWPVCCGHRLSKGLGRGVCHSAVTMQLPITNYQKSAVRPQGSGAMAPGMRQMGDGQKPEARSDDNEMAVCRRADCSVHRPQCRVQT